MNPTQLRALCRLLMCSDAWPVDDPDNEGIVKDFVNYHARAHGFTDWVAAYHAPVPCALCDRGDGQLGHADDCQKNEAHTALCWSVLFKTDQEMMHPKRFSNRNGSPMRRDAVERLARQALNSEAWLTAIEDIYPVAQ